MDTTTGEDKESWDTRKRRYLAELVDADERVLLVSACDKLHNLRSLVSDLRNQGPSVWDRFGETDPSKQYWYYDSLFKAFRGKVPPELERELTQVLSLLSTLIKA